MSHAGSDLSSAELRFRVGPGKKEGVEVLLGTDCVGTLSVMAFRPRNNGFNTPIPGVVSAIQHDEGRSILAWHTADESISACLSLDQRTQHGATGRFVASGRGHAVVRLVWELQINDRGFPFVPAFMYDHNVGGGSPWATYPQLNDRTDGGWAKPWVAREWFMRADRSSHGLTSMIATNAAYALGGRDVCRYADGTLAEKNGLGISASQKGTSSRLSFSLGFANIPYTYCPVPGRNFFSRPEGYVDLDRGEVSCPCFLLAFACNDRLQAADHLSRASYTFFRDERAPAGKSEEAVEAVAGALVTYGYCDKARNFRTQFGADVTHDQLFSTGWAGGGQVAYPLLQAGYLLNREAWIACARSVLCNLAENALNPRSHLFYDNYDLTRDNWSTRGWWYDAMEKPGHSGYVNGQVCFYLLQGYRLEQQHGVQQSTWLSRAKEVLDHVVAVQSDHGGFGYTYDESNGAILDEHGFSGAWFTPALVSLYRITSDKKYLEAATRAMDFYRGPVEACCVFGGPHDTFKSPDAEGILAWIKAAHLLHQTTADPQYLEDLLAGLTFELSWCFAYNVVLEHEPLRSLGWRSLGGCVTSANNPHVHPMNCSILSSMAYAARVTGDEYLQSRLTDRFNWTLNTYQHRDGQFGWGKRGMINERFCHTDAVLLERFADGRPASTWFCGHSWASGSVLEGLCSESA